MTLLTLLMITAALAPSVPALPGAVPLSTGRAAHATGPPHVSGTLRTSEAPGTRTEIGPALRTPISLSTADPPSGKWRWPLEPTPRVVRGFSPPDVAWLPGHRGVDLAARPGQAVYAAGPGRVSYAGRLAGRGVVAITHGVLRTTYLPVRPSVRRGREVSLGARIGIIEEGPYHCSTPCLHWGLLRGSVYLDPLSLVNARVRLLPHWPPSGRKPAERPTPTPAQPRNENPRMGLRDATTATGGAVAGMALAFAVLYVWRQTRVRARRRLPSGVIDLSRERRLRRTP
ncbi:M23 family metallopeptidase [Actinomadura yumaensis]|uniref:M23 family metallopeptidase n=2 Tax=Actinomadura TaxID=1988 RepID=A0ABW2CDL4_9ACTN|nr:peptidoglycan DD-metalloendopeptidase family protein [Actinomadura sp. J1-007]